MPRPHPAVPVLAVLALAFTLAPATPAVAQTWPGASVAGGARAAFGAAVAIADGDVLVGEPNNTLRPGTVYLYRKEGNRWVERAQLRADDAEHRDGFGSGLAVDGRTLAVGAANRSRVYIFERQADRSWRQVARLDVEAGEDGIGNALALRGDVLLVGAPTASQRAGTVHVFRRTGGRWAAAGTVPVQAAPGDMAGTSIAFDGTRAFVGAPGRSNSAGAVFTFTHESGSWTAGPVLVGAGIEQDGGFGAAIRLEGSRLYVGAPSYDGATGAVFAFEWDDQGRQWQPTGRLLPFDGSRQSRFGAAIAATSDAVWVGAPSAARFQGAVYVFESGQRGITGSRRLDSPGSGRGGFASAIATGGNVAVIGAPGQDSGAGVAAIFDGATGSLTPNMVESPIEALDPVKGRQVECTERRANSFDCNDVDLLGFLPVAAIGGGRGIGLNDIWGWTDPQTGKEYALVGRQDGTAFVDISNPVDPVYVGQVLKTPGSPNAAWRDIKVYRDHAFIVADAAGEHGVQVFDLTRLRTFRGEPITFEPDTTYHNIHSAHNIVINEESGFAYSVGTRGGESCGGGLHMIDIREPKKPTFAGCFADPLTGRAGTGYSHDAQCVMYKGPDPDYRGREICLGSNETMLSIADVTDKRAPKAISRIGYPNVAYAHQGWLTDDHRYFLMNDEGDEINGTRPGATPLPGTRTLIWDLSDLDDPQLIKEFYGTTRASDHNLYVKGNLVYESNYNAGLRILDITDINNPVEVGYFDTAPWSENNPGFSGSWSNYPFFGSGVIVVSSIREGLFIVKKRTPRPIS